MKAHVELVHSSGFSVTHLETHTIYDGLMFICSASNSLLLRVCMPVHIVSLPWDTLCCKIVTRLRWNIQQNPLKMNSECAEAPRLRFCWNKGHTVSGWLTLWAFGGILTWFSSGSIEVLVYFQLFVKIPFWKWNARGKAKKNTVFKQDRKTLVSVCRTRFLGVC